MFQECIEIEHANMNGNKERQKPTKRSAPPSFENKSTPALGSGSREACENPSSIRGEEEFKKRKLCASPSVLSNQPVQTNTPATQRECEKNEQKRSETHSILHIRRRDLTQILTSFRRMKRSRTVCFRSDKQAQAVHLMLQRQFDLFLVMPTGYGKTDLMLLTAYIEQSDNRDLLSVMIVPLLSLQSDILYRCANAGIRADTWQNRSRVNSLTVLIVSVEHVENPDFSRLIAEQANKQRLARIEMDECHTTGHWDDFRPSYASLRGNLRPFGVPVQIVLASATVSPTHTEELAEKHGVMSYIEIRLPTVRRNLSYAVRRVETTPTFQNVEEHLCRQSTAELQRQIQTFTPAGTDPGNGSSSPTGKYAYVGTESPGKEVVVGLVPPRREDIRALPSHQSQQQQQPPIQMILYCPTRRIRSKLSSLLNSHDFGNIAVEKLGFDSSLTREE